MTAPGTGTNPGHDEYPRSAAGGQASGLGTFDPTRPNIARVYDCWLGGKDNFAVDRELADRGTAACPELPQWARDNRAFVCAAGERAARAGITQFIDLGCGLPTHPALHEATRSVASGTKIAYVDNDPVVIAHARALLDDPGVAAVQADLTETESVLADPGLRDVIDLDQPVCVILAGVLHFMPAGLARQVCAAWAGRLPSGSWLAVAVGRYEDAELIARLTQMYTPAPFVNHTPAEFATFLSGLDLVPPGVAEARHWQAGTAAELPDRSLYALCAAAVKR